MNNQNVLDGFQPPNAMGNGVDFDKVIYDFIKKAGCSYPSELRRELGICKDTLYFHLFQLTKQGYLKKHNLMGKHTAPEWMKPRLPELWSTGLKGDRLKMMAWYTIVEDGVNDPADSTKPE